VVRVVRPSFSPEEYAITTHVLGGWRAALACREDSDAQAEVPVPARGEG
jgi:hypothetical protein